MAQSNLGYKAIDEVQRAQKSTAPAHPLIPKASRTPPDSFICGMSIAVANPKFNGSWPETDLCYSAIGKTAGLR